MSFLLHLMSHETSEAVKHIDDPGPDLRNTCQALNETMANWAFNLPTILSPTSLADYNRQETSDNLLL